MKRISWKSAIFCGLAITTCSLNSSELRAVDANETAAADPQAGGGARKGGNQPPGGKGGRQGGGNPAGGSGRQGGGNPAGGGGRQSGGNPSGRQPGGNSQAGGGSGGPSGGSARSQPSRNRTAPIVSGRGGIHAPALNGPRQSTGRDKQQPIVRTPSFSRLNPGDRRTGITRPPVPVRPAISDRTRNIANAASRANQIQGTVRRGIQDLQNSAGFRAGTSRNDSRFSRIGNRPFNGNTFGFNDRQFNVGHSRYQPSYYRHSGYNGYWNSNRGFGRGSGSGFNLGSYLGYGGGYGSGWGLGNGFGNHGGHRSHSQFGYRPIGWGLGGWGLGSLIYNSGYLGYANPYYSNAGSSGYNYSQPIQVTYNAPAEYFANDPNSPDEVLNNAVAAFRQNGYDAALDITNKGIARYPDDAVLHEFRSLVLFAKQDYQQSAGTIHSVLAVGPGWDWTTLSGMYSSVAVYTDQLRALEAFTKSNPQDAASHFLLAYHYLTCGHTAAAARHLQQVVQLMPDDRVAADILKMVAPPEAIGDAAGTTQASSPPSADEPTQPAAKSIDPQMLVGSWKATRADGSAFSLTLSDDTNFTWSFTQKDQPAQEFGGTYAVERNVLALERKDGGSLIAEVTPVGDGQFNFRLLGAPDDDPGLDFIR